VLVGGKHIEETPQFKSALEERQRIIRQEYETKLNELERERQQLEDDKVHVERYKHLLLKQRDIMIGLTSRLNERDETIINLQTELDRVDQMNSAATRGSAGRIKTLEYLLRQNGIEVP
jgi:predicted RNase H-like nuclease (RuvC/YqgF family)